MTLQRENVADFGAHACPKEPEMNSMDFFSRASMGLRACASDATSGTEDNGRKEGNDFITSLITIRSEHCQENSRRNLTKPF